MLHAELRPPALLHHIWCKCVTACCPLLKRRELSVIIIIKLRVLKLAPLAHCNSPSSPFLACLLQAELRSPALLQHIWCECVTACCPLLKIMERSKLKLPLLAHLHAPGRATVPSTFAAHLYILHHKQQCLVWDRCALGPHKSHAACNRRVQHCKGPCR